MGVESEHIFYTTERSVQRVEARQRATVDPGDTEGHSGGGRFGKDGPTRTKLASDVAFSSKLRETKRVFGRESVDDIYGKDGTIREDNETITEKSKNDARVRRNKLAEISQPLNIYDFKDIDPRRDGIKHKNGTYPIATGSAYKRQKSSVLQSYDNPEIFVDFDIAPNEIKETYSNKYARHDAINYPFQIMQYVGGSNPKISFTATFDEVVPEAHVTTRVFKVDDNLINPSSEINIMNRENQKRSSLDEKMSKLISFIYPEKLKSEKSYSKAPSLLIFRFGQTSSSNSYIYQTCLSRLTSLSIKRTMFRPDLGTRIAEVDIELEVVQSLPSRVYAEDLRR